MLEIIQYVTSGFWVFIATLILTATIITTTGWAINAILIGIKGKSCGNVTIF